MNKLPPFYPLLGSYIRQSRKAKGLTLQQVAISLKPTVAFQLVQRWENGTGRTPVDMLFQLVDLLKLDWDYIKSLFRKGKKS